MISVTVRRNTSQLCAQSILRLTGTGGSFEDDSDAAVLGLLIAYCVTGIVVFFVGAVSHVGG